MSTPTHDQNHIALRRARVAQLKARCLSSREIAIALAQGENPILSPQTGRPYDQKTILADLAVLQQEWREARLVDTEVHIDRQFAEIQEIKRAAWAARNPELALKAIDREMKLLGTSKALEFNFNFDVNIVMQLAEIIESRGESASQWFMEMLQEFALADGNSSP